MKPLKGYILPRFIVYSFPDYGAAMVTTPKTEAKALKKLPEHFREAISKCRHTMVMVYAPGVTINSTTLVHVDRKQKVRYELKRKKKK